MGLLNTLQRTAGSGEADATLSCLQGQDSSAVEHLICTQLSATSRPSPVLGLALHYPPAQLICLLSDFRCDICPIHCTSFYFLPHIHIQGYSYDQTHRLG